MNRQASGPAPEHEFEAEHGLPQPLPRGEHLLWQGSPDWRLMARDAMHVRALAVYFAVLLVGRAATVLADGAGVVNAMLALVWLLPLALLALGVLTLMAWLMARTSVYTITDRRVVMRIGVVLSITFNLPFPKIDVAALRTRADGSGDVTLLLASDDRIAWVHLWPHVRPWEVRRTQPMLRALPDARQVAAILSAALAHSTNTTGAADRPMSPVASMPAAAGVPTRQRLAA